MQEVTGSNPVFSTEATPNGVAFLHQQISSIGNNLPHTVREGHRFESGILHKGYS